MTIREAHLRGTTPTPAQYRRELRRLLRNLDRTERETIRTGLEALQTARRRVIELIGDLPNNGTRILYERALQGIDQALDQFRTVYAAALEAGTGTAYGIGNDLALGPLGDIIGDLTGITAGIPPYSAVIAGNQTPLLIQGLTDDLRRRIRGELASVLAGAGTPLDAAGRIGRNLTTRNHFSTIAHRARAITVTEMGRAQALGSHYAQQQLSEALEIDGGWAPVRKRWINAHLPGARATHLEAEARYAEGGSVGPIPLDEPYTVAGIRALYPRDPALPASESVNCHCVSITVIPCGPGGFTESIREATTAEGEACMIDPMTAPDTTEPLDITDDQWDALAGDSGLSRNEARALLKETPDGEDLLKVLDRWNRGEGTLRPGNIRQRFEEVLAGRPGSPAAQTLLRALRQNSAAAPEILWRGVSVSGKGSRAFLESLRTPGTSIDLSLSSFSRSIDIAGEFAQMRSGSPVMIRWSGRGKQALPLEGVQTAAKGIGAEQEWLAGGTFKVRGAVEQDGILFVDMIQDVSL